MFSKKTDTSSHYKINLPKDENIDVMMDFHLHTPSKLRKSLQVLEQKAQSGDLAIAIFLMAMIVFDKKYKVISNAKKLSLLHLLMLIKYDCEDNQLLVVYNVLNPFSEAIRESLNSSLAMKNVFTNSALKNLSKKIEKFQSKARVGDDESQFEFLSIAEYMIEEKNINLMHQLLYLEYVLNEIIFWREKNVISIIRNVRCDKVQRDIYLKLGKIYLLLEDYYQADYYFDCAGQLSSEEAYYYSIFSATMHVLGDKDNDKTEALLSKAHSMMEAAKFELTQQLKITRDRLRANLECKYGKNETASKLLNKYRKNKTDLIHFEYELDYAHFTYDELKQRNFLFDEILLVMKRQLVKISGYPPAMLFHAEILFDEAKNAKTKNEKIALATKAKSLLDDYINLGYPDKHKLKLFLLRFIKYFQNIDESLIVSSENAELNKLAVKTASKRNRLAKPANVVNKSLSAPRKNRHPKSKEDIFKQKISSSTVSHVVKQQLFNKLPKNKRNHIFLIAGGYVRYLLSGRCNKKYQGDIDIVTNMDFDELKIYFSDIQASKNKQDFYFLTLTDENSGTRVSVEISKSPHFEGKSFKEGLRLDAENRDYLMNSNYLQHCGLEQFEVLMPFGKKSADDAKNGQLTFVKANLDEYFQQDPVRLLRHITFLREYKCNKLDTKTFKNYVQKYFNFLDWGVSLKKAKIKKYLMSGNAKLYVNLFIQHGFMQLMFPNICFNHPVIGKFISQKMALNDAYANRRYRFVWGQIFAPFIVTEIIGKNVVLSEEFIIDWTERHQLDSKEIQDALIQYLYAISAQLKELEQKMAATIKTDVSSENRNSSHMQTNHYTLFANNNSKNIQSDFEDANSNIRNNV